MATGVRNSRIIFYAVAGIAVVTFGFGVSLFTSGTAGKKLATAISAKHTPCDPLFTAAKPDAAFPYTTEAGTQPEETGSYATLVEELHQELAEKNRRIGALEDRLVRAVQEREDQIRVLQRQVDAATGTLENTLLEELTLQIQEKTKNLRLADNARADLQDQLAESTEKIARLETRLMAVTSLQEQLAERDENNAHLEGKNKALVEKLATLPNDLAELERDAAMTARLKEALTENEGLLANISKHRREMELELERNRTKLQALENVEQERQQLAQALATKDKLIDDLNRARNSLLEDLGSSNTKATYLQSCLEGTDKLKDQVVQKDAIIQQLQQELKQARRVIASFDRVKTTLGARVDEVDTEELLACADDSLLETLLEKKTLHPMAHNR